VFHGIKIKQNFVVWQQYFVILNMLSWLKGKNNGHIDCNINQLN